MTYQAELASIGALADAEIATLSSEIAALAQAKSDLELQVASREATITTLSTTIEDLKAQIAALTAPPVVTPPVSTSAKLRYAPPVLVNPTTITLSNTSRKATLDINKDYIIKLSGVIDVASGIEINGGRNVVLIGGTIRFSKDYSGGVVTNLGKANRAIYIKGNSAQTQPRTVHIEGVHIAGDFTWEGINIDSQSEPGMRVQIQNVRVDRINVYLPGTTGSHEGGDFIQCWNGPTELFLDRLTGADLRYQGFFIQSNAFGTGVEKTYRISNVNLVGRQPSSAYLLWHSSPTSIPIVVENVWVDSTDAWPDGCIWPKDGNKTWGALKGVPPTGDFVPASSVGANYISPGYL